MERRLRLRQPRTEYLLTRERGAEQRARLEALLDGSAAGDTVVLDLTGVATFDFSFANEFFGRALIALPQRYPGRAVIVEGLTEVTRENLVAALKSLDLAIVERSAAGADLRGAVNGIDRHTFRTIANLAGPATSAEVAGHLSINVTTANERLAKLTRLAVVFRVPSTSPAGREQFVYAAPA